MKAIAIVPAYNEEKNIGNVVTSLKLLCPFLDVLVINDGSRDKTSQRARSAGAIVIDLPNNLGIGGAVQSGYIYARNMGYEIAIQVDGDGQHDAGEILKLIRGIKDGAHMVVGSRFLEKKEGFKSTFFRRLGIKFFTLIIFFITGKKITDATSGFRAVNRNIIELFSNYYPVDYPEVESVVYVIKKGFWVKEVSVSMRERENGKSSITPLRSLYYMLKVTFSIIFRPREV